MKIAIGSDHGGFALKQELIPFIEKLGFEVKDFGCPDENSVDYPDVAFAVAEAVAAGEYGRGIIICGTGLGVSICANKVDGIRCALLSDLKSAEMTRLHNDTNMMALGAGIVSEELALQIVDKWLDTPFSQGPRHQRRIDKVMALEK